jgi:hypothetical protein
MTLLDQNVVGGKKGFVSLNELRPAVRSRPMILIPRIKEGDDGGGVDEHGHYR